MTQAVTAQVQARCRPAMGPRTLTRTRLRLAQADYDG